MKPGVELHSQVPDSVVIWNDSCIMDDVVIGEGTRIGRQVHIGRGSRIGERCKIQNLAQIFGARIGNHVLIGPSVTIVEDPWPRAFSRSRRDGTAGLDADFTKRPVVVADCASIGAGAIVRPGVTIGRYAMIGVGSVILSDIPDFALVLGNPGRVIDRVCQCGQRIANCRRCDYDSGSPTDR